MLIISPIYISIPSTTLINVYCSLKNISSGVKVQCTLWDEFAEQFTKYIEDSSESSIILVMQLARTKRLSSKFPLHNLFYANIWVSIVVHAISQLQVLNDVSDLLIH